MNDTTTTNWVFEKDAHGDWIGRCSNGRRTALKGSEQAARADAEIGRLVCAGYPNCDHWSVDECSRKQPLGHRH